MFQNYMVKILQMIQEAPHPTCLRMSHSCRGECVTFSKVLGLKKDLKPDFKFRLQPYIQNADLNSLGNKTWVNRSWWLKCIWIWPRKNKDVTKISSWVIEKNDGNNGRDWIVGRGVFCFVSKHGVTWDTTDLVESITCWMNEWQRRYYHGTSLSNNWSYVPLKTRW